MTVQVIPHNLAKNASRMAAGGLPTGWRSFRLGDHVLKIGSGVTPTGGHASYASKGIPLIRSQNVHMNRFADEGLAFLHPEQDADMEGMPGFAERCFAKHYGGLHRSGLCSSQRFVPRQRQPACQHYQAERLDFLAVSGFLPREPWFSKVHQ